MLTIGRNVGDDWQPEDAPEACDICGTLYPGSQLQRNADGAKVCERDAEIMTRTELEELNHSKIWGEEPWERP